MSDAALSRTPLYDAHIAAGGKMVPFAGYEMPVQYGMGVLKEHLWTREKAGLFDVSHMGQARLIGDNPFLALEKITPTDVLGLKLGRQRYSLLLNEAGGTVDDFMISRPDGAGLFLVVNGACKAKDFAFIEASLAGEAKLQRLDNRALLALQGPMAVEVLKAHAPGVETMSFMDAAAMTAFGVSALISRSGYTGEDGYEISIPATAAAKVWKILLADERVAPIGLGARDSLRMEAGLPLYGHELDETISPAQASLGFAISRRRLQEGFPGALRIARELTGQTDRLRVGLVVDGAPAREGAVIANSEGEEIGVVTSGGFAPTLGKPIALGFVPPSCRAPGTVLHVIVRGRAQPATVTAMPFVPHRYARRT